MITETEKNLYKKILHRHGLPSDDNAIHMLEEVHDAALEQAASIVETIGSTVNASQRISPTCYDCVHDIKKLEHK